MEVSEGQNWGCSAEEVKILVTRQRIKGVPWRVFRLHENLSYRMQVFNSLITKIYAFKSPTALSYNPFP
jgi:hypothetical protein